MFSPPKAANAVAANPFNFAAFSGGGQPAQKVRSGWANAAKPPPPPVPPSGFASLTSGSSPGGHSHKAGNSASNSDEIGLLSDLQRRSLESSVRVWAAGDLLAEGCARFQLQHHAAHTSDATATTPTPTPSSSANTIAGQPTAAAPPLESFARAADQPPGIAAAMPHFVLPPEHGGNPARALLCYQLAPRALNARSAVQPVGPGVRPAPMSGFVGAPLWPQLGQDGASLAAAAAADAVGVSGLAEPAGAANAKLSNQNIGAYVQAAQAAARSGTPEEQAEAAQSIDAKLVQPVMARVAANIDELGGLGGGGVLGDTVEESLLQNVRQWEFVEEQLLDPTAKMTSAEVLLPAHHLATSLELTGKYYLLRGDSGRATQALERACPLLELLPPRQLPLGPANGAGVSNSGGVAAASSGKVDPGSAGAAGVGNLPQNAAAAASSSSSSASKSDRRHGGGPALSFAPDSGKCFNLLADVYRREYDDDDDGGGAGLPRWPLSLDELSKEAARVTAVAPLANKAGDAAVAAASRTDSIGSGSASAASVSRKPPPPPTALLPDDESHVTTSTGASKNTTTATIASTESVEGEDRSSKRKRKRSKSSTTESADAVATLDSESSSSTSSLSASLDHELAAKLDALRAPYQHLRGGAKKNCDSCDSASTTKGRRSGRSSRRTKSSSGSKALGPSSSGRDEGRDGRDQLDLLAERFAGALLGPGRARNNGSGSGSMVVESAQRESRRRAIDSADTILRLAEATVSQLGSRGSSADDTGSTNSGSGSSGGGSGAPMCDEYLRVMRRMLLAEEADFDVRFAQPSQAVPLHSGASGGGGEIGSASLNEMNYGGYTYPTPVRPDLSTALLAAMEHSEMDHGEESFDGSGRNSNSNRPSTVPSLVSHRLSTMATSFGDAAFLDMGTFGDFGDGRCHACLDTDTTRSSRACCSADGSSASASSRGHALGRAAVKVVAEEVVIAGHLWRLAQQQLVPLPNHSLGEDPAGLPDDSAVIGEGQAKEDVATAREAARQLANFMEEYVPGADLAAPVFTLLPPVIRLEIASVFGEAVAKSSAATALAAAVSAKEAAVAAIQLTRDNDGTGGIGGGGSGASSGYGADAYINDVRREHILDGGSSSGAPPLLFSPFDQAAAERRRRGFLGRAWDSGCSMAGLNPQRTQPAQLAGALVSGAVEATWTPAILAPGLEAIAAQREVAPHLVTNGRHTHYDRRSNPFDAATSNGGGGGDDGGFSPFWAWWAHFLAVGFVNWLTGDGFFGTLRLMLWRVFATCVVLECAALLGQACVFGIFHNALTAVLSVRREFLEAAGYLPNGSSSGGYGGSDDLLFGGDDSSSGRYTNGGRREKGSKRRGENKSSHHRNSNTSSSSTFGPARITSVDDGAFLTSNSHYGDSDGSHRGSYYSSSGSAGSLVARAEAWMPPPVQSLWWSLTKMALRRAGYGHLIPVPKPKTPPALSQESPSTLEPQSQVPLPPFADAGAAAEPEVEDEEKEDNSESSEQSDTESDIEATALTRGAKGGNKASLVGKQASASSRQGAREKASNAKAASAASSAGRSKEPLNKQKPAIGSRRQSSASEPPLEGADGAAAAAATTEALAPLEGVSPESAWQPAVKRKERMATGAGSATGAQASVGNGGLSSSSKNGKMERASSSGSSSSKAGASTSTGVRSSGVQGTARPQASPTTKTAPVGVSSSNNGRSTAAAPVTGAVAAGAGAGGLASPRSGTLPPTSSTTSVAPSAGNAAPGGWANVLFKATGTASVATAGAPAQAASAAAASDSVQGVVSTSSSRTPVRRSSGGHTATKIPATANATSVAPPPGFDLKPSPKANSKEKATAAAAKASTSTTAPGSDPFALRSTSMNAAPSSGTKSTSVEPTPSSPSSGSAPVLQHVAAHPPGRKGTGSADGLELDMWFELERSIAKAKDSGVPSQPSSSASLMAQSSSELLSHDANDRNYNGDDASAPSPQRHPSMNVTASTPPGLGSATVDSSPAGSAADPSILFDLGLGSTLSGSGNGGGGNLFDTSSFAGPSSTGLFDDASSFVGGGLGGLDNFGAALLSGSGLGMGLVGSGLANIDGDAPLGSGGLGGDVLSSSDELNLQSRTVSARSRRTFASDESALSEPPPGI